MAIIHNSQIELTYYNYIYFILQHKYYPRAHCKMTSNYDKYTMHNKPTTRKTNQINNVLENDRHILVEAIQIPSIQLES